MPTLTPSGRQSPQIPLQSRHRILLIVREIDAALDENTPWRNRFGVFRHQRPLLRRSRPSEDEHRKRDTHQSEFHESLS